MAPEPPPLAQRLTAQMLAGPQARDPVAVAQRLLAIQGQDPRGARLAVRARTSGLSAADVDRALTAERSLVIGWCNRGTLHLVRSEDYPWLLSLTAPPLFTGNASRLAQMGVRPDAADRGVAAIKRALTEEGPRTRAQLRDHIASSNVATDGQILVHLLMLACLRGVAVRGPMIGRQHAYALVHDWLGESPPVDRDRALAELARRYLAGHAPAGDRDLARWAGLPLRDARAGLGAIASELRLREDGLLELARAREVAELPPPRLLGAFDPVLLGWSAREFLVGEHGPRIMAGGRFHPFVLVEGRAVATWGMPRGEVSIEPFARLDRRVAPALRAEAADVVRYLGGE